MRSRVLAATLAVLIGSTAEVGATLIVVYRSDSEVVIAADSRGAMQNSRSKSRGLPQVQPVPPEAGGTSEIVPSCRGSQGWPVSAVQISRSSPCVDVWLANS